MSDLNDLIPESNTVVVTLKHPNTGETLNNDDGSPMTITLMAPYTREYKALIYKQASERIQKSGGVMPEYTYEELDEASTTLLSSATTTWNITFNGENPKFSAKKAKEIYEKVFWIKPQVEEAIASHTAFTKV
jgi:hypothetical protein